MKRILDFIFSLLALLLLLPLMLSFISILYIFQGRPIFFIQERIGKDRKKFYLYKFRSMKIASHKKDFLIENNFNRITYLGKFIRKLKIDEIPQLLNIIKGDMSFVGPRPELEKWTNYFPEKWKIIHSVRPGITDPASIYYRNEEEILSKYNNPSEHYLSVILPHKLEIYENYVINNTIIDDIKIFFKTFIVLLKLK
jgi:lipopolysaccharide/colanic/teichoic acid biosynthesis glycosyltransferase